MAVEEQGERWLSLTPKRVDDLPNAKKSAESFAAFVNALDAEADALFSSAGWTHHKEWFKGLVTTSQLPPAAGQNDHHHPANQKRSRSSLFRMRGHDSSAAVVNQDASGIAWHMRSTTVSEGQASPTDANVLVGYSYDDFWDVLAVNHLHQEQEYVANLTSVVDVRQDGSAWLKLYSLPFPTTNRSFLTNLLVVPRAPPPASSSPESDALRSFSVYSIPVNVDETIPDEKGYVRGRYCTVERVSELGPDDQGRRRIEWKCASMSTPGGSIPVRLAESHADSGLATSVPTFFEWMAKRTQAKPEQAPGLLRKLSRQLSRIKS